jgi:hypothetical protein
VDGFHSRVAGIDVHKNQVTVAVRLPGELAGEHRQVVRTFRTFWRALQKMAAWLAELAGCVRTCPLSRVAARAGSGPAWPRAAGRAPRWPGAGRDR